MKPLSLEWDKIEKALGSRGRLRILRCLNKNPHGLTRYRLGRETGLSQKNLRNNLDVLLETGFLEKSNFAPIVFNLNLDNPPVRLFIDFLTDLEGV